MRLIVVIAIFLAFTGVRSRDRVHAWASRDTVPVTEAGSVVPIVVEGVRSATGAC
jgi:hypothetical protein